MKKLISRTLLLLATCSIVSDALASRSWLVTERPVSSTLFQRENNLDNFNRGYEYGRNWNYRGGDYLANSPGVVYIDSGNPISSEDYYIS